MRKIIGIISVIATTLLLIMHFSYLPTASRVEDLTESGAGLELNEWQINVGIFLSAVLLFAILTVILFKIRFAASLTIVSGLALCCVASAVWFVYSLRTKTGVLNEHGHGLAYDQWWASVIPWTIALGLVALCAASSLAHLIAERHMRGRKPAHDTSPNAGPAVRLGNSEVSGEPPSVS